MYFFVILIVFIVAFLLGPRTKVGLFWNPDTSRVRAKKVLSELTSADLRELQVEITAQESNIHGIVDGGEKHIEFSSESRSRRTPYCVLYIHGYSACRQEISPIPENIAKSLHANYYGTRLTGHGLNGEALGRAKPNDWLFDLAEAWHVAEQLGEKVILISTSTGGTLATWLAQQPSVLSKLAAIIMVSPNFQPKHWAMPMFLWPWSKYWMPLLAGHEYGREPTSSEGAKYWTYRYPTSTLHNMAALVRTVRKTPVEHIETPTLFIYSDHDQVVNPKYTDNVARRWGSPIKHRIAVPKVKDNNHVVTGDIVNPQTTEQYTADILSFLKTHVLTKK